MSDSCESDIRDYKEGSPYLRGNDDNEPLGPARADADGEDLGVARLRLNRACLHRNPNCLLITSFIIS